MGGTGKTGKEEKAAAKKGGTIPMEVLSGAAASLASRGRGTANKKFRPQGPKLPAPDMVAHDIVTDAMDAGVSGRQQWTSSQGVCRLWR